MVLFFVGLSSSNNGYNGENNNSNDNIEISSKKNVMNTIPGVLDDKEQDGLKFINTSLVYNDTILVFSENDHFKWHLHTYQAASGIKDSRYELFYYKYLKYGYKSVDYTPANIFDYSEQWK